MSVVASEAWLNRPWFQALQRNTCSLMTQQPTGFPPQPTLLSMQNAATLDYLTSQAKFPGINSIALSPACFAAHTIALAEVLGGLGVPKLLSLPLTKVGGWSQRNEKNGGW